MICVLSVRHTAEKGGENSGHQALAWGTITKIHALTEGCGRAIAFALSPGNHADISEAPALLDRCPAPARLLADKGHDANCLRDRLAATKTEAVIPSTRSGKVPIPYDAEACRELSPRPGRGMSRPPSLRRDLAVAEPLAHRRETLWHTLQALALPVAALLPLGGLWVLCLTRARLRPMTLDDFSREGGGVAEGRPAGPRAVAHSRYPGPRSRCGRAGGLR
ncbi:transposase [Rhodobacter sp. SGA-6-6]|uniref:transposase n=1 Tax=Rhodobacter sp. SGA-6-6 TaxID=2710882 RepID=UPI0013EB9312|nr:transposase [Rhodobacter sp. SGA-6-6]NGM47663.1 transposase [Rhodobacter sp. SGA-6-6]